MNMTRLSLIAATISCICVSAAIRKATLSLAHNYTGKVYLDDENTRTLPGYHTFDAKFQLNLMAAQFVVMITNLTNNKHNSTGFSLYDPFAMNSEPFLYPNRGRHIQSVLIFRFENSSQSSKNQDAFV